MGQTVAILGGGIGGLSAAHELAERGFEVRVFESKPIFGGKARSIPVPNSAVDGRKLLPGEHGFRFFPGFYRHVHDTMSRIPFRNNPRGVLDNLVPTTRTALARAGAPDMLVCSRFPRDRHDWKTAIRGAFDFVRLIPLRDMVHYVRRLLVWLTSCDERRLHEYEHIPWWEFTQADNRSAGYQQFLGQGFTRLMVAIRAEEGSTRTVGAIGLQLGLGLLTHGVDVDSVLSGPTNEMWIDPWVAHLTRLGVVFQHDAAVRRIHTDGRRITHVTIEQEGRMVDITADYYVAALPVEVMTSLLTDDLKRAAPSMANIGRLRTAWMNGIQFYLARRAPIVHGHIVYVDSPWALTSVSQDQFWDSIDLSEYGDGEVKGILSVDISDWETPGMLYGRPAKECDAVEIKNEVWLQILAHLDADGQKQLRDAKIMRWFLDPRHRVSESLAGGQPRAAPDQHRGLACQSPARPHRDPEPVPGSRLREDGHRSRVHGIGERGGPPGRERSPRPRGVSGTAGGDLAADRAVDLSPFQGMGSAGVRARRPAFVAQCRLGRVQAVAAARRETAIAADGPGGDLA